MISNICRANFNGGRTAQGNNRYQWDYGQILEISGIENLPDPFTAQFSNTPVLGTAKTAVGTGGSVEIPNEYFVSGQNIYCFIVLHTDEDDGRTVYVATIPVTKRPKPIDDPITPTQQSTIDTAIAALQAGVAKAEGFAGDAEEQAGIAQSAATTATEAATRAEGAVADVEAAATRAEQAADGAEASATAAGASATGAETAKAEALAAQTAAEAAQASAEEAETNAQQSATTAEWYAERVERFLPTDTASGEIASFPDGADGVPMQSVVVTMEPIQDLNGYDHPWPAGGGKNLFDEESFYADLSNGNGEFAVKKANIVVYSYLFHIPSNLVGQQLTASAYFKTVSGANCRIQANVGGTNINGNLINATSYSMSSVTFTPVSTDDYINIDYNTSVTGSETSTFKNVQLELGTTATAFAPYSNICPISGRTGLSVFVGPTADQADATTYAVDWESEAGTVYGGTLDVVTGELVVDRAMVTYDGSENWYTGAISGGTRYRVALDGLPTGIKYVTNNDEIPNCVANLLPVVSANTTWSGNDGIAMQTTYGWRIYCHMFNTSDVTPWKAFLSEHPLTICYELATPITYHLTPQEMRTLLGDNNVWSDAGDMAVTYKADVQLYIDKRISALS